MAKSTPPKQTIAEQSAQFYETYGRAALAWNTIEVTLFLIFDRLLNTPDPSTASAAYHSVINLNTRLTMIDEVAGVALKGDNLLEEWNKLSSKVRKRSKKRNNLAHFIAIEETTMRNPHPKLVIRPSFFDVTTSRATTGYDLKQIQDFLFSFLEIGLDLQNFLGRVPPKSLLASPRKFPWLGNQAP